MNLLQSDAGIIKIELSFGDDLRADSFQIKDDGIYFHLANAQPDLLKHKFENGRRPSFWTNYNDVHRRRAGTLRCLTDVEIDWDGQICKERPVYIIKDADTYKRFQSELQQVRFIGDFAADQITPVSRGIPDLRDIKSSHIKVWHNKRESSASITVPFTRDNVTIQQDIPCSWFELETGALEEPREESDTLRILRRSGKRWKAQRSFTAGGESRPSVENGKEYGISRPKMSKVASWSTHTVFDEPVDEHGSGLPVSIEELHTKLDEIEIVFKNAEVRNSFIDSISAFLPSTSALPQETVSRPDSLLDNNNSRTSSIPPVERQSLLASPKQVPRPGSAALIPPQSLSPARSTTSDGVSERGSPSNSPNAQQSSPTNFWSRLPPSYPPRSPHIRPVSVLTNTSLNGIYEHASLAQGITAERKKFWERQSKSELIADNARERARQNRSFYTQRFSSDNEIRLLSILPGNADKVFLESNIFTLHDCENDYEALSYAWGPGKSTREVVLNNRSGFVVSSHLEAALRRLRLPDRPRVVWIDAICINQMDVHEMNHQVGLMGTIYQHAKRTIIWIGELTPQMLTCERIYAAEEDNHSSRTLCANKASARDHFDLNTTMARLLREFFKELDLSRSHNAWHLRLWCVQEFHFSKALPSVYIGAHAIGWAHFESIFQRAVGQHHSLSLFKQLRDTPQTMHTLCALTGAFKVSNPRDRIYSLLHMTKDHPHKLTAEYQRSILEVFEDATLYCILESKSVDVLLDRRLDRSCGDDFGIGVMPSYIPDFTKLQMQDMTIGNVEYCTGDETEPRVSLCEDKYAEHDMSELENATIPRLLLMEAKRFDSILHRTTIDDIPDHEASPSGEIIYNSFTNRPHQPGTLIKNIFAALQFRFHPNMSKWGLNRSPRLGRLILEYLLEETRNYGDEMDQCVGPGPDLNILYQKEKKRDRRHISLISSSDPDGDSRFIGDHWNQRMTYINEEDHTALDVMRILDQNEEPWDQALHAQEATRSELQVAIEFENLFCYARKTTNKYYFTGKQYHRPMRKDVLSLESWSQVPGLTTQGIDPDDEIEGHEYSEKSRSRDFFCTKNGFVGLGPSVLEEGDEIVVPYGASRPFIFRRCLESSTEKYDLIGEAIVPGIMHGEWMASRNGESRSWMLK